MKEKSHKGLTEMVSIYGSVCLQKKFLPKLLLASIEPDLENRQNIENNLDNFFKVIPILSKWLYEHTIGAKELAVLNLRNAYNARLKDDPFWVRYLGITFHYITDWGTPYHSPISLANPVISSFITGGISMWILKLVFNWINGSSELLKNTTKWSLFGASTFGGVRLIKLYLDHKSFEEQCDKYWDRNKNLIIQQFIPIKKNFSLPIYFEQAIEIFEDMMDNLRNICSNTSPNSILLNNGYNFVNYIIQIAAVMDLAIQIITYY